MGSFHVASHQAHLKWDNSLPPVLTVDSGSEVSFDLKDGGNNQFDENSTTESVAQFDLSLADPAFGPVYINSAEPGDVLQIEFLELQTAEFGWTAIFPAEVGFGLLADEFPSPSLKIWDLETHAKEGYTVFKKGIHIPLNPFLGVVGVARGEEGEWSTIPPYETGGNIDCRHITVGSKLLLPIKVAGALFSCGDGHAAQGDGEVCGTAIETPMRATVKLTVIKSPPSTPSYINTPHYLTPAGEQHVKAMSKRIEKGEYAAMGIDSDLREASRKAVRGVIAWLVAEKGLSREEAYMLCSVVGDLRVVQAVDMPHFGVSCQVPLSVFVDEESE